MLIELITRYGYAALFGLLMFGIIGIPVPDEFLLLYAGYNVSMNRMTLIPTIIIACLGAMCGITLSYLIGRYIGLPTIKKFGWLFHITDKNIQKIHDWFEHWGKWTLTFGYFFPVVRHLSAIVSGTSKLTYRKFAVFAYSGAVIWVNIFVLTGFFLGHKAPMISEIITYNLTIVSISALLSIAIVLTARHYLIRWKKG
jgi:membrane protein DedA with SNARE-associated domain